jgi:hypothetical membrane protein
VWLAAGVGYLILEATAAAGFQPGYSYTHNLISDLGVTEHVALRGMAIGSPRAYLMNTAFYLQGIGFLAGALLLVRGVGTPKNVPFLCFAAANALGNVLVGTFHSGLAAAADGTAAVHRTGAALAIIGGNAAIIAGSSIMRKAGFPQWYRAASLVLAVVGFGSLVMLLIDSATAVVHFLPDGAWERGSVYPILAWQMCTALCLLGFLAPTPQRL